MYEPPYITNKLNNNWRICWFSRVYEGYNLWKYAVRGYASEGSLGTTDLGPCVRRWYFPAQWRTEPNGDYPLLINVKCSHIVTVVWWKWFHELEMMGEELVVVCFGGIQAFAQNTWGKIWKNIFYSQLEIQAGCHPEASRKRFTAMRARLVVCKMRITVTVQWYTAIKRDSQSESNRCTRMLTSYSSAFGL
jgi:hypothetical protein